MKNEKPLISIVMINYNRINYLKKTIPPILKLDYPNYEFIIVDNGSTDGSIEFIKKFKKIRLIKSQNIGNKNFACNYAIRRAKGEYILLIDNDALIKDYNLLYDLLNEYNNKKDIGLLGLSHHDLGQKYSIDYGKYFGYFFVKITPKVPLSTLKKYNGIQIGYPSGIGIFIKKSIWNKVGGYDDYLKFGGDDNDIGIKLWLMGYHNYFFSKSQLIHLGLYNKKDNLFYQKIKDNNFAALYTITKNYRFFNMILELSVYSIFLFLKSIKQLIINRDSRRFFIFFQSYYLFLKNLPIALKKRKEIQSKRVIKKDIFLKIKPPKFTKP
jgi:glycosyltransferase involved in cell wall biosynthesis